MNNETQTAETFAILTSIEDANGIRRFPAVFRGSAEEANECRVAIRALHRRQNVGATVDVTIMRTGALPDPLA